VHVEHDGSTVEPFDDRHEVGAAGHHSGELAGRGQEHAHISNVGAGRGCLSAPHGRAVMLQP
jgi:hypothetical protein